MPRIKFGNKEEFIRWIREITIKRKYTLYIATKSEELVAIPLVSTDPVIFGIYRDDLHKIEKIAQDIKTELRLSLYVVDSVEFHDEPKP